MIDAASFTMENAARCEGTSAYPSWHEHSMSGSERGTAMTVRTTGARWLSGVLVALIAMIAVPSPADAASPCPPGQPPGRPPGRPPGTPGQPPGRPPQYPPGQCQLRLSSAAGAPGSTFTAAGAGFAAGSTVQLSFGGDPVSQATTDGSGAFTASLTVPADAASGATNVVAAGVDPAGEAYVLSAAFTVTGATTAGASAAQEDSPSLPRTGSSALPLLVVAIALIGAGAFAATIGRRKRAGS